VRGGGGWGEQTGEGGGVVTGGRRGWTRCEAGRMYGVECTGELTGLYVSVLDTISSVA